MTAARWPTNDPELGTAVVQEYGDPALADKVVHFVGRQRGNTLLPSSVSHLTAEQRLAKILISGRLLGFPVYQSGAVPVISVSDLSAAELETAFSRGLNSRGRLEPWAVVLDRPRSWEVGFRPVIYAEAAKVTEHRDAMAEIYGPSGRALVVRTEMGTDDWTAEREWRYCFPPSAPQSWTVGDPFLLPAAPPGVLDVRNGVRAVIVGKSNWVPHLPQPDPAAVPPERWLWDDGAQRLVHDGRLPLW